MNHFIKIPAFSTAKMTVRECGIIVFNCQIIVFVSQKCCLLLNCTTLVDFIFCSGLPPIQCVKVPSTIGANYIVIFYFYFSERIKLGILCES